MLLEMRYKRMLLLLLVQIFAPLLALIKVISAASREGRVQPILGRWKKTLWFPSRLAVSTGNAGDEVWSQAGTFPLWPLPFPSSPLPEAEHAVSSCRRCFL